jgi:4-amino-4-deoxy-L-arabinose transferase-like glycosyltransferase
MAADKTNKKVTRHWWSWEDALLIVLLAGALYLPGLARIPLFDRDEPRFAEAAREMLTRGNLIVPRFDGVLRPDKPPVIYWLMDVSYKIFGVSGMAARLPSVLFGTLTLLVVYWMAGRRFGRAVGLLSALMLSVAALYFAETRLATADSVMIFFTTVCMACVWEAWDAHASDDGVPRLRPRVDQLMEAAGGDILNESYVTGSGHVSIWVVICFWVSMAAGIMTKGVTPIFVLATMIALSLTTGRAGDLLNDWWKSPGWGRMIHLPELIYGLVRKGNWGWWRLLRPLMGFGILILLVLPWFIAAWHATNGKLIEEMLSQNLVKRTSGGLQGHGEPPGFYLLVIWGIFWPWSVLLVPAAYHAIRRVRGKLVMSIDPSPYQFILAWVIPSWLIFECIVTKMVEYILPLFIPLAILCADTLVQSWHRMTDVLAAKWFAGARWVWMAIWIGMGLGAAAGGWRLFVPDHPDQFYHLMPLAAALIATGAAGAIAWQRPAWPYVTVLCFGLTLMIADVSALPSIKALQLSREAGQQMRRLRAEGFKMGAVGYLEPSLVFYARGHVQLFPGPSAVLQTVPFNLRGHAGVTIQKRYCIVADRRAMNYFKRRHIQYYQWDWFKGLKIAKGRPVRITLITNVDPWPKPRAAAKHAQK